MNLVLPWLLSLVMSPGGSGKMACKIFGMHKIARHSEPVLATILRAERETQNYVACT